MEPVIDKVISELETMIQLPESEGGLAGVLDIKMVHWDDPGFTPIHLYPYIVVEPEQKTAAGETTGYDTRDLSILITIWINAPEYYDPNVSEAAGGRIRVRAAEQVERWFMRFHNRRLDFMPGVRALTVPLTNYDLPPRRGTVKVKGAQVTLTVQKQYSRQV